MANGGKDVVAAAGVEPTVARRMWRVVRAVLYMMRRGAGVQSAGRKLAMDIHLLLHRGKIAGKALGDLVTFHGHGHGHHRGAAAGSSLSCRAIDPALAVYEPSRGRREVEFSCSNTPSANGGGLLFGRRRGRSNRHDEAAYYHDYDAADIAMVFEMLNDSEHLFNDYDDDSAGALAVAPVTATPSPARWSPFFGRRSPAARRPRVTDSPFAATDDNAAGGQLVDRQADEFITRFYAQLRAQRSAAATPDYYGYGAAGASSYGGHAPRPVATGIA